MKFITYVIRCVWKYVYKYKIILLIIIPFVVFRIYLILGYSFPFNLYCGDSAYYLHLASHLDQAAADRPSGYPMFLSLLLPIIYKNWYVIPITQTLISFIILILSLKILINRIKWSHLYLWILFVFFNYHTAFMEKSIMPDTIAYNLLVLGSIILISGLEKSIWKTVLIGIISGLLPLLRTNYLVFSLLFVFISTIQLLNVFKFNKKFFLNLGLFVIPFLIIYFVYVYFFVNPRLGVSKISSFGGRTLFSRVMVFTDCNQIKQLNLETKFSSALIENCHDSNRSFYNANLFSETGLISMTDKSLSLDRAKSDVLYVDISKRIIAEKPLILFSVLWESLKDMFIRNELFYRRNFNPVLGGGCEILPQKFGVTNEVFLINNDKNYDNKTIMYLAFFAGLSQKIIVLILYVIIPVWLLIIMSRDGLKLFINNYLLSTVIWVASLAYFTITIMFTGFDYRYVQPLWLTVSWIFISCRIKQ